MKAFFRTSLVAATALLGVSALPAQAKSTYLYNLQFERADLDHDGFLSMTEFMGLQSRGESWTDAAFRFNTNDANHDGYLDPLEFRGSRGGKDGGKPDKVQTFILADEDDDGFLDPAEFARTLPQSWSFRKVIKLFTRKDRDESGVISPREYGLRVF